MKMTKELKNDAFFKNYGPRFRTHVWSFLESLDLLKKDQKILISASAGVDSMSLLDIFIKSKLKSQIEVIHFNHQTRVLENTKEENLILKTCRFHDVKVHVKKFNLDLNQRNFENVARELRKKEYQKFINNGFAIFTAHHLDDSFEWSLMQSFKHSGVSSLGIPVFSDGIIRPFMCASKKQITQYAQSENLLWLEDSSNENIKFERNYFRKKILKEIYLKYPKALKHYAHKSNEMAYLLKKHVHSNPGFFEVKRDQFGGILIQSNHFTQYGKKVKELIFSLSDKNRGQIDEELRKLFILQNALLKDPKVLSEKGPMRGPHKLSGNVWAYVGGDFIYLTNAQVRKDLFLYDEKLVNYLKIKVENKAQIPEICLTSHFPKLVIGPRHLLGKSSKFIHPLLEQSCQFLKRNDISFCFLMLLEEKVQQKLAYSAVILDSSVLDL